MPLEKKILKNPHDGLVRFLREVLVYKQELWNENVLSIHFTKSTINRLKELRLLSALKGIENKGSGKLEFNTNLFLTYLSESLSIEEPQFLAQNTFYSLGQMFHSNGVYNAFVVLRRLTSDVPVNPNIHGRIIIGYGLEGFGDSDNWTYQKSVRIEDIYVQLEYYWIGFLKNGDFGEMRTAINKIIQKKEGLRLNKMPEPEEVVGGNPLSMYYQRFRLVNPKNGDSEELTKLEERLCNVFFGGKKKVIEIEFTKLEEMIYEDDKDHKTGLDDVLKNIKQKGRIIGLGRGKEAFIKTKKGRVILNNKIIDIPD